MEKRIFTLILVVTIGVLVGVGIVSKQAKDPILRELLRRQDVVIQAQNRIERNLGTSGAAAGGGQVSALLQKQQNLEGRLAALEAKIKNLETAVQQAKGGGGNNPSAPPREDLSTVYDIPVDHSYVRGNKRAPITIVEFADFQCPFCARFHPPVNEVLKTYPKKVNYVLKNFPLGFHPEAKPAAKVAFAAGEQGKYWEMVDALLENGSELSVEKYQELAKQIGLNINKFNADLKNKDGEWEALIQKDVDLAAKVGVRGTPTFYLNGKKTNARDVATYKREIDQILNSK